MPPMKALLAPLVLLLGACAATAPPVATVRVPPPLAAQPVTERHWGVDVADPYRHLENVADPAVQAWLRAQADATGAVLDRLPGRAPLLERIKAIEGAAGGVTTQVIRTDGGRLFFMRRDPGEDQFKLVWRDGADGADRVVYDPQAGAAGSAPRAVMDFAPSRDGSKLAYSVQSGGGEIGVLHVIDVASGRELIAPIDRIRYAGAAWLDDGSGFFYGRLREGYEKLPPGERFGDRTTHFRSLVDGSDRAVFSASRNPELQLPPFAGAGIFQVRGTQTAAALVFMGVDRNLQLLVADLAAARQGGPVWRRVVGSADQVTAVTVGQGTFFLKSALGTPRYRILAMPVADPVLARAQVVVPQGDGAIGEIMAARDGLYFTRRDGVNTGLWRLPSGTPVRVESIALPFVGSVDLKSASDGRDGAVVGLVGWARAFKDYVVEPSGRVALLPLARPGAYDAPSDIESREVLVRSHDGTMVPLSIVMKKGTVLDGRAPTILYGYGAYGVTDDPFFNPRVYAWIERGGIWATAHVRGGGVYGKDWHEAGRKTTKANTWKDAIALGEWLVANRYTSPARMAIYGGSAGGIYVGRAITERPDLFAAAVPAVGVMDAVRMESSANGVANVPEFGTVKKEDEFKALLAMSSYHQLRDGTRYPAVMAVHGVNDIRVDVWQSAKFVSRLATASASGKPVLLRLEYDSGHGQGSTRAQAQVRSADLYSFLLWQFGDPAFQPVRP
jgi:prolyl oligopeptidase